MSWWGKKEETPVLVLDTKGEKDAATLPTIPVAAPSPTSKQNVMLKKKDKKKGTGFSWKPPRRPNPGKYEDLNKENKSIVGTQDIFDGFKFDLSKNMSNEFGVNHSLQLGSVFEPASYSFGTNWISTPHKIMMWGRVDTEGHLVGRAFWPYDTSVDKNNNPNTDNYTYRFTIGGQASREPHNSGGSVDLEYKGSDWHGQLKWINPGTYGLQYFQSITKHLAIGGDVFYNHKQAMSLWTVGGRYATNKSVSTCIATLGHVGLSYTQKVNEKVGLSTELAFTAGQNGWESVWSLGYEYRLRMGMFRGHIDSGAKVAAYLEEFLNPNTKFILSGELDHSKKQYRFGVGLSMAL